jgi:uncharacterized protein
LPLHVDVAYLNATAAVAALRAELDFEGTLYVRESMVLLPTLGALRLEAPDLTEVKVSVSRGRLRVILGGEGVELPGDVECETETWLPARRITARAEGLELSLTVEDLDYYRDSYKKTVAGRLSDDDFALLATLLQPAWEMLVRRVPQRAAELAVGLRSMVPLSSADAEPGLSATSGTAYGALALTIPKQPSHLAATLVHEFQHSKLSALLDLVPLYDKGARDEYFAAWKTEPRPFGGLLQGSFAFLAVSEFWMRLYEAGEEPAAERYFAELRSQVEDVINTLQREPHLNEAGRTFVVQMRSVLDRQLAVPVTAKVDEAAKRTLHEVRQKWELRKNQGGS